MLFRKIEISVMHLQSNLYAFCLADNKFCDTKQNALDKINLSMGHHISPVCEDFVSHIVNFL